MDKREPLTLPPGGSSLLVILAVLCLTVFALLGLSTAQAGKRLSDRSAEATAAYYRADAQAEEILARLRRGEIPQQVEMADGVYSYTCPISDTQQLQVSLRLEEDGACTVLRWQSVSTAQWQPEEDLELWDGEDPETR